MFIHTALALLFCALNMPYIVVLTCFATLFHIDFPMWYTKMMITMLHTHTLTFVRTCFVWTWTALAIPFVPTFPTSMCNLARIVFFFFIHSNRQNSLQGIRIMFTIHSLVYVYSILLFVSCYHTHRVSFCSPNWLQMKCNHRRRRSKKKNIH